MDEEAEALTIFAVNRNLEQSLALEGDVRDFAGYVVIEHIVLEHANLTAVNTMDEPENVVPHTSGSAKVEAGQLETLLPRASWNVILLEKWK